MKKITMLIFLSFCAIGFSQNKSQDQNKEIKAPTGIYAQTAELPAAYFNNPATTVGENAGVASNGQRDTNVTVPFTGTYYTNRPDAMIYDNGPYWNVDGSPKLSLLESSLGMNTLGAGAQFTGGNSIADDVVFTEDVEITSIDVFAYQSFETAPTVTGIYLQVWDGDPSGGGASVIWGDLGTNILADAVYADTNRASETDPANTDRQLNRVTANTPGLSLSAGTYWIEYTFEGSGSSGPWAPPIVILGETTTGNALQNQNGTWVILEDSGTFTPQGLPFVLYGEFTGGGGDECDQEHPLVGDAAGGSGSSQDSDFTTAADIVVVAGEDFTIDTILVPFLTFAPEDAPISATVTYYEDAAGLPGTEIGTETVVPTILSSGPWVNPVAFEFETQLDVTPFTFNGDASSDTSYWISITMGTATNQGTVFWEYTNDTPVEGQPYAKLDATIGDWAIDDPLQEVVYNFSGECSPLGVADNTLGGFSFYPNPTSGSLSLKSVKNIETVEIFNLLGQKVLGAKIDATTSNLDISRLNVGTYVLQVSVEGKTGTYKILKN